MQVVYKDLPDLIEIETRVRSGEWSGLSRAYTDPFSLAEGARGLLRWTASPRGEFVLDAGADTGIGWLQLRWYPINRSGHLACHVQLATRAIGGRPEEVRRLSLEMPTETAAVERFARELAAIAESLSGEATLAGC